MKALLFLWQRTAPPKIKNAPPANRNCTPLTGFYQNYGSLPNRYWTNTYFFSGGFAVKVMLWYETKKRRLGSDPETTLFCYPHIPFPLFLLLQWLQKGTGGEVIRMESFVTDERAGLKYELVGDYYLIAGDDEPEEDQPIGVWGQRHLCYLKEHRRVRYTTLLTGGELNAYLADIDRRAEELFLRLVKQMADADGISETLKANDQMEWVGRMNNVRSRAFEIVEVDIIYT
jgi:hypothetical protein